MKQKKLMNVKLSKRGGTRPPQESSHRCMICGRPLTDVISIERGVGAECWGKYKESQNKCNIFDRVKEC